MSNKGSSVTGILGGAGGGSGGVIVGQPVSGGTPSTLLWVDSGGLVASGTSPNASADTQLRVGGGVTGPAAPTYSFGTTGNNGMYIDGGGIVGIAGQAGTGTVTFANTIVTFNSGIFLCWNSGALGGGGPDTGLQRLAAGIIGVTLGTSGVGWLQNSAGEEALNANYTNATATFSNTNLSITVISGRTYNFEVNLFITESIAADGWQIDFNGGTAAMTNFIANAVSFSETGAIVALANAVSAALATVINATTTGTTGGQWIKIQGSFVPSGNGTFIVRAAQNAHSTGTLTIKRGSNLITRDSRAV